MQSIRPMTPFRQRLLEDRPIRHLSPHTLDGSLRSVAQCAKYFNTSPDRLGPEPLRPSQLPLLNQKVDESLLIQTGCALRFLYEKTLHRPWPVAYLPCPKNPKQRPVLLSRDEVQALMRAPRHLKPRLILATLSTTGVRASELCRLPGTDIDSERMGVLVRQGKGTRDRQGPLFPDLLPQRRRYWKRYGLQSWLFPGRRVSEPLPRHGVHHICDQAGHAAQLNKAMYPHLLRHYAARRVMPNSHRISGGSLALYLTGFGIIRAL